MSKLISTDKEYAAWVADLKHRFRSAQIKAAVKVNRELLIYYWQLGRDMVNMNIEERWGEGIMKTLSQDLKDAMPEENGFSKTNLYYIKKFYTAYSQIVMNFPQVGGKMKHHILFNSYLKLEKRSKTLRRCFFQYHGHTISSSLTR